MLHGKWAYHSSYLGSVWPAAKDYGVIVAERHCRQGCA